MCFPILPTAISSPNSSSAPTLSAACLFIHPWSQLLLPTSTQVSGLGSGILLKFDEKCQIWNLIKICQRSCIIFISLQKPGWSNVCTHYPALTITIPSLGKLHYKRCRPYLRLGVCVCVCTVCVFKRLPGWFRKLFYWRIFLVQMGICLILGGRWRIYFGFMETLIITLVLSLIFLNSCDSKWKQLWVPITKSQILGTSWHGRLTSTKTYSSITSITNITIVLNWSWHGRQNVWPEIPWPGLVDPLPESPESLILDFYLWSLILHHHHTSEHTHVLWTFISY